jgi:hypothetical protein
MGSAQEFGWTRILGHFLEDYKLGSSRGHALGLQQQIAQVAAGRKGRRLIRSPR